ncbi:MAG: GNAT family N-acetyltransferase [Streptomycetaceae bacterium]|jgi:mycothiol synthase|nr:MAG: GNAT family N-acetyltransferase [Streptomycetaceae bacterium]
MRHILKIHRTLQGRIPDTDHGFSIETFNASLHKQAWLELNNKVFTHHPDQGHWVMQDLENRMAEPWFDAAGFFIAVENGQLVGTCWTKIHHDLVNQAPVGELFVVGVDPDYIGHGIGRAVSIAAMNYLFSKGIQEAMLYVDADNVKGLKLYEALGFN